VVENKIRFDSGISAKTGRKVKIEGQKFIENIEKVEYKEDTLLKRNDKFIPVKRARQD